MKYSYRLYGLGLRTSHAVAGLYVSAISDPDDSVDVTFGSAPEWTTALQALPQELLINRIGEPENEEPAFRLHRLGVEEGFALSYSDGTEFIVDGPARRVWGKWQPPLTFEDLLTYFVGPVMGFILWRRGILALHASAVAVDGRAILFCGDAEAGKSTLAAALALRGTPVLCEDIAALQICGNEFSVSPGYPRICLWPESVTALGGSLQNFPLITPNWEKRYLPLDGRLASFQAQPLPLGAIYLLSPREDSAEAPRIEEIRPSQAVVELVQNTYVNRMLNKGQRAEEFDLLTHLVASTPVRRIIPHTDSQRINVLVRLVAADAGSLKSESPGVLPSRG